jgi:glycosyltransferase involved in cell wall biosynthesis
LKILYVSGYYKPAYVYGGPVAVVSALCEQLVKIGVELTVMTTDSNGTQKLSVQLGKLVNVDGVNVIYFPISSNLIGERYSSELIRSIRYSIKDYDIVILDGIWSITNYRVAQIALMANVPYVLPLHGQLMSWALKQKAIKKKVFLKLFSNYVINQAAALHCASYSESSNLLQFGFRPPSFVVPYGIEIEKYFLPRPSGYLHRMFNIPDKNLIIVSLGRIHKVKGPEIALSAFISLKRSDVHLIFVGPDEQGLQAKLIKQARTFNCSERLHFTGLLTAENVVNSLLDTNLLIMPSLMESFGSAALEAMAAQVPVLLSDQVPLGYWVLQTNAGKVVPCNPIAFSAALSELLNSKEELEISGKIGQNLVEEKFTTGVIAREFYANLDAIVKTGFPK